MTSALIVAARGRLGPPSMSPPLPSTGSSRVKVSRTLDAASSEPGSQEQLPTCAPASQYKQLVHQTQGASVINVTNEPSPQHQFVKSLSSSKDVLANA